MGGMVRCEDGRWWLRLWVWAQAGCVLLELYERGVASVMRLVIESHI